MNYLANDLNQSAKDYAGGNIWEDVFGISELDRDESTDDRAVFSDGSMLVLSAGIWEFKMFNASGNDDDSIS